MFQTGYVPGQSFIRNLLFDGSFCRWWFVEKENVLSIPAIDPATQFLTAEPLLVDGALWHGPVKVPDHELGFDESMDESAAGIIYKQKINGFYPGDRGDSRVNLDNLTWHEFVIIAKARAGEFYLVFGNDDMGFEFDPEYSSGEGVGDTPGAKIQFTGKSILPATPLLSFSLDT